MMLSVSEVGKTSGFSRFRRLSAVRLGMLCAVLTLLLGTPLALGDILNVPSEAYPTIQSAIDAALDGDTVEVAPGIYVENIYWDAKGIVLLGSGAENTIVDGNASGECLDVSNAPATTLIDGFTFRNGLGGVRARYSSITVANCIIEDNEAYSGGYNEGWGGSPASAVCGSC